MKKKKKKTKQTKKTPVAKKKAEPSRTGKKSACPCTGPAPPLLHDGYLGAYGMYNPMTFFHQ